MTYILQWDSLADLETKWTVFLNDPTWHKVRDESERDGPIAASINNQILAPTAFSALNKLALLQAQTSRYRHDPPAFAPLYSRDRCAEGAPR
jgi:hypothetical protein